MACSKHKEQGCPRCGMEQFWICRKHVIGGNDEMGCYKCNAEIKPKKRLPPFLELAAKAKKLERGLHYYCIRELEVVRNYIPPNKMNSNGNHMYFCRRMYKLNNMFLKHHEATIALKQIKSLLKSL